MRTLYPYKKLTIDKVTGHELKSQSSVPATEPKKKMNNKLIPAFFAFASQMADLAWRCLNDDAINRPEMREIVHELSHILTSSMEWEASLGGNDRESSAGC